MSLINDALKRVSEAERKTPPSTPKLAQGPASPSMDFETRAMQPVPSERRTMHLLWISFAVCLVAVGVAGFLFAKAAGARAEARQQNITAPVVAQPKAADVVPIATPVVAAEQPKVSAPAPAASSAPSTPVSTPSPIANATPVTVAPAASAPTQPAPVAAPPEPTFRLKGILYTKTPTAMINESAVQVGGEVDGATVTKIEERTVTISYEGKTSVLKIGGRQN
jgi:hypothetical protein